MGKPLWIDQIGKRYVLSIEPTALLVMLLGVSGGIVVRLLGGVQEYAWVMMAGFGISLMLEMIGYALLYRGIRCPKCGGNPTQFKNGKNRSRNHVYKILRSSESCPICNQCP